eukprot:CAMPEP_0113456926 /NCGR_PEP_ID=MMETSP0014_2-20120614/9141_1 /TAXON_ID=2857 /ORGANISM="Nitzschia sp." /LENGTH=155 /DNA_ID=CAMNT_0000348399 /DNA_START=182 /DNA_END=649 /DNA_ORIENTATION=+ /assembly_acc=CAM_ASM_000159
MRQRPNGYYGSSNSIISNGSGGNNSNSMYARGGSGNSSRDIEGGGGGGGGRFNDTNAGILEQQNNERIYELSEQVSRLKGLTLDINKEVREQNNFLDQMEAGFENAGDMIKDSLGRIGIMLDSTSGKHMCYMVMFAVFVVIFLYWMMTYKGKSGA